MKTILAVLVAVLTFNSVHAQMAVSPSLEQAHRAYLANDGRSMVESMRQSLIDSQNDPVIVKNVTDLFDKYVVENKRYPEPSYKLNSVTNDIFINSQLLKRYDDQATRYFFAIGANLTQPGLVQSIQLIRYPNEVVIDTQAGVGDFEGQNGVDPYAWSDQKTVEPKLGLYNIVIKYKNQEPLLAWFILTHRNQSDDTPQIEVPLLKQHFNVPRPELKWKNFKSAYSLVSDKKKVGFAIRSIIQEKENDVISVEMPVGAQSFTVGNHAQTLSYTGVNSLVPGLYSFRFYMRERNRFGPIRLIRSSISKVRFTID